MRDEAESDSQVRGIINKLNEEHPSKERSREVVVREDGSKVTRVRRKRRVTLTDKEKKSKSRRKFTIIFSLIFILVFGFAVYLGLQVSSMGGTHYLEEKRDAICLAFKAESIEMTGAKINGLDMTIGSIVLNYPAGSLVQRVELSKLRGSFDLLGLVEGKMLFDSLSIDKANVQLKEGATNLESPDTSLGDFCAFERIDCKEFNLCIGAESQSPLTISNTSAYLYYPDHDKDKIIFSCSGGRMTVKNWLGFEIKDLRAAFIKGSDTDLGAELVIKSADASTDAVIEERLSLRMKLAEGDSFYGPYTFTSNNLAVNDMTDGRLSAFFAAKTKREGEDSAKIQPSTISFSPEAAYPTFSADLSLGEIAWTKLPALQEIQKHVESAKRALYTKLIIPFGRIKLQSSPEEIILSFSGSDMTEPYSVTLVGELKLNADDDLSGSLEYGVPANLTRREYPDGLSDPIFKEEGATAWMRTNLSGSKLVPMDNSLDLDLDAAEARKLRPSPNSLDVINIDTFADRVEQNRAQADDASASESSSE